MIRRFACAALVLTCIGCGSSDGLIPVSGTVKLDGQPIDKGSISFAPVDGTGQTAGSEIVVGAYKTRVPKGKLKVSISAMKVVGTKKLYNTPNSPEMPVTEERVPAKFNKATELVREVTGSAKLDFDLNSQP
jgi:hypothetical protein